MTGATTSDPMALMMQALEEERAAMGSHSVPEDPQNAMLEALGQVREQNVPGHIGGLSAAAADGFLFGAGDEYLAGLSAALGVTPDEEGGANWFDYSDGFLGGMDDRYGVALDQIRAEQDQYQGESPVLSGGAEVAGGIAGALLPVGAAIGGGSTALRAGAAALRSSSLPVRMGAGAGAGAALSGAYGFNEGEGGFQERAQSGMEAMPLGALVGGAMPVAGAGIQRGLDRYVQSRHLRRVAQNAPSSEDLRAMGNSLYQQIDDAGVAITPEAARRNLTEIIEALRSEGAGYRGAESVLPGGRAVLNASEDIIGGLDDRTSVPFREMDMLRRFAGNAAGANPANRADTRLTAGAIAQMDDMIQGLGLEDVTTGDLETLQRLLPQAREVWARMSRSQTLDDAIEAAGNYVSGEASGIRNQFRRIVSNPRLARGFSDSELAIMRRVAQGSIPEQVVYLLSSGIGNIGTTAAGYATGGLTGAAVGAAGSMGLRNFADRMARSNAEMARAIIANGGVQNLPVASHATRDIVEALSRRMAATGQN